MNPVQRFEETRGILLRDHFRVGAVFGIAYSKTAESMVIQRDVLAHADHVAVGGVSEVKNGGVFVVQVGFNVRLDGHGSTEQPGCNFCVVIEAVKHHPNSIIRAKGIVDGRSRN